MTPGVLTAIFALLALVTLAVACIKLADDDLSGWGFICALICAVSILVAILVPSVTYGSRHFGRIACKNFHVQSNYPTKFVLLNSWDTGTCLARTRSGRWVPKEQLVGVSR